VVIGSSWALGTGGFSLEWEALVCSVVAFRGVRGGRQVPGSWRCWGLLCGCEEDAGKK